jgi:hypothetical protein
VSESASYSCLITNISSHRNFSRRHYCELQKNAKETAYEEDFQVWYKDPENAETVAVR